MDELWGLASHPSQHQFMTSGSDKQVHMWDSMSRSVVWSKELSVSTESITLALNVRQFKCLVTIVRKNEKEKIHWICLLHPN